MGPVGLIEIVVLLPLLVAPVIGIVALVRMFRRRRAKQLGYTSTAEYLRAVPRSDAEKRDAVDLAMKGVVFCALGLVFSPFVLVGLVPLFYGCRKLVYASMGLGLVDDADDTRA